MAIFSFLNPVLDFIFGPLLNLGYFWAVLIMSILLSFIITIIYKYTTNQSLMKDLKTEVKELQAEMKELRNEPEKMMTVQKKAMETNMKYMTHSMKPMLFTFIPIIIIFGWMGAHFAYQPLMPDEPFSVTLELGGEGEAEIVVPEGITVTSDVVAQSVDDKITWEMKGEVGEYLLEFKHNDDSYVKEILITEEKAYAEPFKKIGRQDVKSISVNNEPVKILNLFINGWKLGWIGTYIIFSIISSILIRKWMKVY